MPKVQVGATLEYVVSSCQPEEVNFELRADRYAEVGHVEIRG